MTLSGIGRVKRLGKVTYLTAKNCCPGTNRHVICGDWFPGAPPRNSPPKTQICTPQTLPERHMKHKISHILFKSPPKTQICTPQTLPERHMKYKISHILQKLTSKNSDMYTSNIA